MDFSLLYFACDDGVPSRDKYRLLMEGAKFADQNEFAAVWTPERHFHSFGGLYPNPSVLSAALAMVTERVQLRAGSVVLPLHHPLRVAEEWAVVDNLSHGRVAVSFASGWHANDFVFAPESFADRRKLTARQIELVRKLWRGESIKSVNGAGEEIEVSIFPRPIQRELPVWLTSSGHPESFGMAGELGANVLTHLLGQSAEQLAARILRYRQSWGAAGHEPGASRVTLMLHTFVGEDSTAVRETVRRPLIEYLKTASGLFQQARPNRPPVNPPLPGVVRTDRTDSANGSEVETAIDCAFERYFHENGLFGTPEHCREMVARFEAIGVDEIACLIDFGIAPDVVLRHLGCLNEVRQQFNTTAAL